MRLLITILLLCAGVAQSEIIPSNRIIDWQGNVGIVGGIPSVTTIYTNFALAPSGAALQNAMNNCPSNKVILLGAWTNTYSDSFKMQASGVVLRGATNAAGKPLTKIILSGDTFKIQAGSSDGSLNTLNTAVNISATANKGDTVIAIATVPSWIVVGELYIIDEIDDSSVKESGQQGGMNPRQRGKAQLVKIISKTTTNITIEIPLYETYRTSQTAQIAQSAYTAISGGTSVKRCGVENIQFEYSAANSGSEGITICNADSCWLKNITSYNVPITYHVWMIFSYRCQIYGSELSYSQSDYGGGHGYGITLYYYTSAGLFENNIVHHTHCGCTVNYGSSGNVFAYNYFFDGYSNQTSSKQEPSISAHGACTWQNLFEGNWCYNKVLFDYTHGTAAIHNTVMRNRILGLSVAGNDRVPISSEYTCRSNNFVGNILGQAGTQGAYSWMAPASCSGSTPLYRLGYFINVNCDASVYDTLSTAAQIIHGNFGVVTNGIVWDATLADHVVPSSYYLAGKPAWFGNLQWPPFDPTVPSTGTNALSYTNIPAGYRYVYGVDPPPSILTIYPANLRVTNGQVIQFYATNDFGGGDITNVTASSFWTSSISALVGINRTTGLAYVSNDVGRVDISATWSNLTATTQITIENSRTYPPKISEVWFIPNPSYIFPPAPQPQVTWVTDKPATTELTTIFCDFGTNKTILDTNLVTSHTVDLTGCVRSLMSVSITATDAGTNTSPASVFSAAFSAGASPMRMCCEPPLFQAGGMLVTQ